MNDRQTFIVFFVIKVNVLILKKKKKKNIIIKTSTPRIQV